MINNNIVEDETKVALYRKLVNPQLMDVLKDKILQQLVVKKKYKAPFYTARKLADDLGTNTRYVSAVVRVHFHCNYTSLVNRYRVNEAQAMLTDSRYADLSIEEIGRIVGFAHRQSFHTAFVKFAGMAPKPYRMLANKQVKRK
jgi:YesN/AraC family two-component response regulator